MESIRLPHVAVDLQVDGVRDWDSDPVELKLDAYGQRLRLTRQLS